MHRYFRFLRFLDKLILRFRLFYSRVESHRKRKLYIKKTGKSVVTRQVKKEIKEYAKERFGSKGYWPHLARYAEIKGKFVKGWIPDDYFLFILEPRLNPKEYKTMGQQKTYDYRRFGEFAIKPLFLFVSGVFFDPDFEVLHKEQIQSLLGDYNDTIVVKQDFGMGGKEVQVMHSSEFKPELLRRNKNYVIQPYIKQHKILNDLYPESVNTLRVLTFLKRDGSVVVNYTMLRFGMDGMKVDNISSGGKCLFIDPNGKPAKMAIDGWGFPYTEKHPNTEFVFADLELPMYQEILDTCIAAHRKNPYVRLIGWDVCIEEHGKPKLIEWNTHRPSYTWEDALFGPFLTDDSEIF